MANGNVLIAKYKEHTHHFNCPHCRDQRDHLRSGGEFPNLVPRPPILDHLRQSASKTHLQYTFPLLSCLPSA